MAQAFGIYVGNSSASIAICKDDKVEILANEAGDRVTPTVVRITSQEQVVGAAAVASLTSRGGSTVTRNKTFLDRTLEREDLDLLTKNVPTKIEVDENGVLSYQIQDEDKTLKYTPLQIATLILKTLFTIGKSAVPGQKELGCVLCVPRHWDEQSRNEIADAAEEAGWKVLQLIAEAPAATLAYRLDLSTEPMMVLVYRLGGVSCEASVIDFEEGFLSVRSSIRSITVGGEDMITIVRDHLVEEFYRKFRLDPKESRKSMAKLRLAAESIIQVLSTLTSCSKFVESVCEGVDFSINVSRARFEALIAPLLPKFVQPIKDAISAAELGTSKISKVVLCGGPLKIPRLVSYITSLFPSDVEVLQRISPDEVFAYGAACQASYLFNTQVLDCHTDLTYCLPYINSPIFVTFNSTEEVVLNCLATPFMKDVSFDLNDETLRIIARQPLQNKIVSGEATLVGFNPPTVLKIQIKGTMQNDLVFDVLNPSTHEMKSVTLVLQEM